MDCVPFQLGRLLEVLANFTPRTKPNIQAAASEPEPFTAKAQDKDSSNLLVSSEHNNGDAELHSASAESQIKGSLQAVTSEEPSSSDSQNKVKSQTAATEHSHGGAHRQNKFKIQTANGEKPEQRGNKLFKNIYLI